MSLGESVFLAQDAMAKFFIKKLCFDASKQNISLHIRNILQEDSVCKEYLHTAKDGKSYKGTQ